MSRKKGKHKYSKIIIFAVVLSLIISSAFIPQSIWDKAYETVGLSTNSDEIKDGMTVSFIDVGQGDCELVSGNDGVILIDSGERGERDTVINYLNSLRIKTINYCIVTHPHSDHYGNMAEILKNYDVENLIMPELSKINIPTTKMYEEFIGAADKYTDRVIFAKADTQYELGKINIKILGPYSQNEDLNYMSVVTKISYYNISFLMTGDCGGEEETEILKNTEAEDLKSTILKVSHHGSRYSSSDEWLKKVSPEKAVISCGKGNSYNHPHVELLKRLEANKIDYYRTDLNGTVKIKTDGKGYSVA